jgi:methylthioribose-1-phosphate isomerase
LCEAMRSVNWEENGPAVRLIDQRLLPTELKTVDLVNVEQVADAIRQMAVRGAPAIGAAAAFGMALAGYQSSATSAEELWGDIQGAAKLLRATRPTAVNLRWALDRLLAAADNLKVDGPQRMCKALLDEAQSIADEDVEINRRIGRHGAALIQDGDTLLHHCNTGALATVDYGTALGVIRTAHEQGKRLHVLVDETRPRLQGARLTAWELERYGIPYEIITDNAAGYFLQNGEVASVFVGADRVAANGDVANKIGTYMLALAAHDNSVPFYCAVPTSTIDLQLSTGERIPIEERDPGEVLDLEKDGQRVAPAGSKARNPAFDVTPQRLITAFVTEAGIIQPPYSNTLEEAVRETS